MNTPDEKYSDAVFIIIEEQACPVYSVGEELKVQGFCLSATAYKPACLHLTKKIADILTIKNGSSGLSTVTGQKSQFDCGGCGGMIHFEFKKEKDFATMQMKMLKVAEERRNRHLVEKHFGQLRKLDIFRPLDDASLVDLTLLLEFKTILQNKRVVKKGASGNHLYIILDGEVAVVRDDGSKAVEIKKGEIFGEMSLLSGEPISKSIHTTEDTLVAMLSLKNFRDVLRSYQKLQFFLLKMLLDRAQAVSLRSGNITSGMAGKLSETHAVDLFQIIHSKRKSGAVHLSLKEGKAVVFFKEGEIIYARFKTYRQKQAVFQLLDCQEGHFHYTRGIPNELKKAPPIGPFNELMMEGMLK